MERPALSEAAGLDHKAYGPRTWLEWLVVPIGLCAVALTGLWWNYLVFHTLAEAVSVVVGLIAMTVAIAAFPLTRNHFLTLIGLGLGWCAILDVLHTLAFAGMGVFLVDGKDDVSLGAEIWVAARFLQAASLLAAPWFLRRRLDIWRAHALFAAYVVAAALLVFTDRLPDALIAGQGQTPYKIGAEYVIIAMLAGALVLTLRQRALMPRRALAGITAAIVAVMLSEACFTLYLSPYAPSNAVGHLLKITASWFFFVALVQSTLRDPFSALARAAGTYDAVPSPALIVDRHGRIVQANRAALAFIGMEARKMAGQSAHGVFHAPGLATEDCPVCRRLAAGEVRFREDVRRDGRILSCSVAPYVEGGGGGMRVELFEDITEAHARTERIAFEARRTGALLRLTQFPADMPEMELMQAGQEMAEELTGSRIAFIHLVNEDQETIELVAWSKDTLAHYCKAAVDRHYPISRAGIWADAFRQRAPVVVNDYSSAQGKKGLPEGHAELLRLISVPVIEGGKVRMMTGVGNKDSDYTETDVETVRLISDAIWRIVRQRRAETGLAGSESRLRALLNAIPDPVWLKDEAGHYLACNPAFERLYGAPEAGILGRMDRDFVAPDLAESFQQHDRAAIAAEHPLVNEEWLTYAADGRRILAETTKAGVRGADGVAIGVLGIARDITEARRLAEERESLVHKLGERVKELRCLRDIAVVLESGTNDVARVMQSLVDHLPAAFERPEAAQAGITGTLGTYGTVERAGTALERPLSRGGRVVGLLRVQYPAEHRPPHEVFLPEESGLLDTVATQVSVWLEQVEARAQLDLQTRLYNTLSDVNRAIVRASREEGLLYDLFRAMVERAGFPTVVVATGQPGTSGIEIAHASGVDENGLTRLKIMLSAGTGLLEPALADLEAGRVMIGPWAEAGEEPREYALVPLKRGGKLAALLVMGGRHTGFTEQHRRLIEEIAGDMSFALDVLATDARLRSAEEQRTVSEARFARIFETSPVPMFIVSRQSGEFRSINTALVGWLGYAREELSDQKHWFERVYPDPGEREQWRENWRDAVARAIATGEPQVSPELRLRRKDGSEVLALGATVAIGDEMLVVWQDLTDIRRGEEALRESEQRFRRMIEGALTGIYVQRDLRFLYANPALARMLGYRPEELIGRETAVALRDDPEYADRLREARSRIAAGDPNVHINVPLHRRDGSVMEAEVHARLIDWVDGPAVIGMVEDITERRIAERRIQEYVNQLRGAMRGTLEVVTRMVDLRDPYTAGHERRVGQISRDVALEMGWPAERADTLELVGLVHDVGKISVPTEILTKPGRLSPLEMQIVRGHAETGYEILKDIHFGVPLAELVRQHHERMDGSGYPRGLKGEEILPEARILAVADVVESMSAHRPYRPALGIDKALAEIQQGRGTLYDAQVVDALLRLIRERGYTLPV